MIEFTNLEENFRQLRFGAGNDSMHISHSTLIPTLKSIINQSNDNLRPLPLQTISGPKHPRFKSVRCFLILEIDLMRKPSTFHSRGS